MEDRAEQGIRQICEFTNLLIAIQRLFFGLKVFVYHNHNYIGLLPVFDWHHHQVLHFGNAEFAFQIKHQVSVFTYVIYNHGLLPSQNCTKRILIAALENKLGASPTSLHQLAPSHCQHEATLTLNCVHDLITNCYLQFLWSCIVSQGHENLRTDGLNLW